MRLRESCVSVVVDSTRSPLFLLLVKLYSCPSVSELDPLLLLRGSLLINVPTSALNTSSTNGLAGSEGVWAQSLRRRSAATKHPAFILIKS